MLKTPDRHRADGHNILNVQWRKTPSTRRREILLPAGLPPQNARPIRPETRALLVASIARGRRWLDELLADANANAESIAKRERCSIRKVNMTISLAFLAPDLVKAASPGGCLMAWECPASPTCPPSGLGSTRCSDFLRRSRDLACVPRARPREGCRRRTTASRHRCYSPPRCSRRVVPPTRDARFVDLILAAFMCNSARCQERVCRAQRLAGKIDAAATSIGDRDRTSRI
jgi:hypothetical protein